jgi:hypothetical protein
MHGTTPGAEAAAIEAGARMRSIMARSWPTPWLAPAATGRCALPAA